MKILETSIEIENYTAKEVLSMLSQLRPKYSIESTEEEGDEQK
jgi:hypothetical protein